MSKKIVLVILASQKGEIKLKILSGSGDYLHQVTSRCLHVAQLAEEDIPVSELLGLLTTV